MVVSAFEVSRLGAALKHFFLMKNLGTGTKRVARAAPELRIDARGAGAHFWVDSGVPRSRNAPSDLQNRINETNGKKTKKGYEKGRQGSPGAENRRLGCWISFPGRFRGPRDPKRPGDPRKSRNSGRLLPPPPPLHHAHFGLISLTGAVL